MLQEELCVPDAKDPTYVAIRSPINGRLFFVNPSTLVMRINPEEYTRSRRGASAILAEDPGSGKTIMVVSYPNNNNTPPLMPRPRFLLSYCLRSMTSRLRSHPRDTAPQESRRQQFVGRQAVNLSAPRVSQRFEI